MYKRQVLVCNTERHSNSEEEYIEELLRRNVDGIIYNTYQINEKTIRYLQEISDKIPVVFMDRIFQKNAEISYVLTDGYNSTRKAVHYLFERGKRKIGYIRNTEDIAVIEERYQGYLQGLKAVSYTHLDVYKRQVRTRAGYQPGVRAG